MVRQHFEQQLYSVQDDVVRMGSMVEKMVMRAVTALKERNVTLAEAVIADDDQVDALAYATEDKVLLLICTQQPVASDLRRLAAALVIVHELERMGDHAEGIAKLSRKLSREPALKPLIDLPRMVEITTEMLRLALQAYVDRDTALAERVWAMDDEVDQLYDQVYRELLTSMMADPGTIERATRLLHVARDIERIGDRVTTICERIIYIATGQPYYVRSVAPAVTGQN